MKVGKTDMQVWANVLGEYGVDEDAQQGIFLLAQHSPTGYKCASAVLAKLYKKRADKEWLDNPSAYVHASVRNNRNTLKLW